jgi:hypothetical protein
MLFYVNVGFLGWVRIIGFKILHSYESSNLVGIRIGR